MATRLAVAAAPGLQEIRQLNRERRSVEAERAARALLAELETRPGVDSLQVAEVLDELATALRRGGKVGSPESREVCGRALRIKESRLGVRDTLYAASLYNLGLLHFMRGDSDSAGAELGRSLEIREAILGPEHPDVAQGLLAIGALELDRGDFDTSRTAMERAVRIQRTALRAGDPELALGLNALGSLEYETGALSGAIPLLEEAISILERPGNSNPTLLGNIYQTLGNVQFETDDLEEAQESYGRALRVLRTSLDPDHPMIASLLVATGTVQALTDRRAEAERSYERAIRILTKAYGPDHARVGWARMKLGRLYLSSGDPARAAPVLREALGIQERALGPDHRDLWQTLLGLAEVAGAEADTAAARGYYERTLRILEGAYGPSSIDAGRTLQEYAGFLLAAGDSAAALDTSLRAARVNGDQLRLIAQGLAERQALGYASSLGSSLDAGLAVLAGDRFRGNAAKVREVWDLLIHWRALILDEVASRNRSIGASEELREPAERLERSRQRLANLLVRGPGSTPPDRHRRLTEAARDEVERAERDLGLRSAAFRAGQERRRAGWREVSSALPAGSALVAFARFGGTRDRAYMAFVFDGQGEPAAVPLGPAKVIDDLVSRWAVLVHDPPGRVPGEEQAAERKCRAAGARLRERIWDPIAPRLGGSRRAFVVPDGSLHLVNLAALPMGPSEYVVESGPTLHLLSAERDLVRPASPFPAREGLLAMGGPAYDSGASTAGGAPGSARGGLPDCVEFRSLRFGPLPESAREVREIASEWGASGDALVLTGADATEGAFKALAPGRTVIHLATHAFFLSDRCRRASRSGGAPARGIGGLSTTAPGTPPSVPAQNPLRLAGIVLAGANRRGSAAPDEEDGIVTAEEIASMDLSRVRCAVLSACDTGAGEIQAGEGVLGLRRAFESAGVSTLVMSLWEVEDASARLWMDSYYAAKFRKHLETDEAVRKASLDVLREQRARARGTHPFYWAGFVAAGDWR